MIDWLLADTTNPNWVLVFLGGSMSLVYLMAMRAVNESIDRLRTANAMLEATAIMIVEFEDENQ